jgi:hypothetical protein
MVSATVSSWARTAPGVGWANQRIAIALSDDELAKLQRAIEQR